MELSYLTAFLLSCLVMILIYIWSMSTTHGLFKKLNIKGPKPWPVLGNFIEEFSGDGMFYYHIRSYAKHKKDKVFGIYRANMPNLVICDLDMIREICVKQFHNFQNRLTFDIEDPLGHSMTEIKDEHWKRVRTTVSPSFSTARLKHMYPHIKRNSKLLIEHLQDKHESNEPVELRDLMSAFTMDTIASTGFGLETNSLKDGENEFTKQAKALMDGFGRFMMLGLFLRFLRPVFRLLGITLMPKKPSEFFTGFINRAIDLGKDNTGKDSNRKDFIQLMLESESDNMEQETDSKKSLSLKDIQGQSIIFLLAGFDTVATVLSFTLFFIATNPECLKKAQEEIDEVLEGEFPDYESANSLNYLEMCINESMRIYPPGFLVDREVEDDIEIEGVKIPGGITVTIPICGIHRDPELWENPEQYDPERFTPENKATRHPYAFMPFGQGPRNCIGMRLAMLEMKVALASTLQALTPVVCDKTVCPPKMEQYQLRALDGLWVKFEARG